MQVVARIQESAHSRAASVLSRMPGMEDALYGEPGVEPHFGKNPGALAVGLSILASVLGEFRWCGFRVSIEESLCVRPVHQDLSIKACKGGV